MSRWHRSEIFVASVAPFNKDGKLLFGKRQDNGKWVLPGGHMNIGESPLKAAVRELMEETGLKPTKVTYLGDGQVRRLEGNLRVYCFRAEVDGEPTGEKDPDKECQEFKWVDVSEGLPPAQELPLRDRNNITLRLLKLQGGEIRKVEDEINAVFLSKAEWYDQPPPLPPARQQNQQSMELGWATTPEAARLQWWYNMALDWAKELRPSTAHAPPDFDADKYPGPLKAMVRGNGRDWNGGEGHFGLSDQSKAVCWGLHFMLNPQARQDRRDEMEAEKELIAQNRRRLSMDEEKLGSALARDNGLLREMGSEVPNFWERPPPLVDSSDPQFRWTGNHVIDRADRNNDEHKALSWGNYLFYHSPDRAVHQKKLKEIVEALETPPPDAEENGILDRSWSDFSFEVKAGYWNDFLGDRAQVNINRPPPIEADHIDEGRWGEKSFSSQVTAWARFMNKLLSGEIETPPPGISDNKREEWASLSPESRRDEWNKCARLMFPAFSNDYMESTWSVPGMSDKEWSTLTPEQQEEERRRWGETRGDFSFRLESYYADFDTRHRAVDPLISTYAAHEMMCRKALRGEQLSDQDSALQDHLLALDNRMDAGLFLKTDKATRLHVQYALWKYQDISSINSFLSHPLVDKRHLQSLIPHIVGNRLGRIQAQSILSHKEFDHELMDKLASVLAWGDEVRRIQGSIGAHPYFTQEHAARFLNDVLSQGVTDFNYQEDFFKQCIKKVPVQWAHKVLDDLEIFPWASPTFSRGQEKVRLNLDRTVEAFLDHRKDVNEPGVREFVGRLAQINSTTKSHERPGYSAALCEHPALTPEQIGSLVKVLGDLDSPALALVRNPSATQESWKTMLFRDNFSATAKDIILEEQPSIAPQTVKEYAAHVLQNRSGSTESSPLWRLLSHSALDPEDLEPYVQRFLSDDVPLARALARSQRLSSDQLHRMARGFNTMDDNSSNAFRETLGVYLDNPAVKPEHFESLIESQNKHVIRQIFDRAGMRLTPQQVGKLLNHPDDGVRSDALVWANHDQLVEALSRPPDHPLVIPDDERMEKAFLGNTPGRGFSAPWDPLTNDQRLDAIGEFPSVSRGEDIVRALLKRNAPTARLLALSHPDCPVDVVDDAMKKLPVLNEDSPNNDVLMWKEFARMPALNESHMRAVLDAVGKRKTLTEIANNKIDLMDGWLSKPLPESKVRVIYNDFLNLPTSHQRNVRESLYCNSGFSHDLVRKELESRPGDSVDELHARWSRLLEFRSNDLTMDDLRYLKESPEFSKPVYEDEMKEIQEGRFPANPPPLFALGNTPEFRQEKWNKVVEQEKRDVLRPGYERFLYGSASRAWQDQWVLASELQKDNIQKHRNAMGMLDPDSLFDQRVDIRFGMQKLRKIRDLIREKNPVKGELKPSELPPGNWGMGRLPNGNISAEKLDAFINSQTPVRFNLSTTTWSGLQRHSNEEQHVLQVNYTTEMMNKLKTAGVFKTFKEMADTSFTSNHPVLPQTLGWVRYTGDALNGFHIDETQSDFGQSFVRRAAEEAVAAGRDVAEITRAAEEKWGPDAHYPLIRSILFGERHPNEVLNEAWHEWMRSQGATESTVMIHSVESAAVNRLKNLYEPCVTCMANADKLPKEKKKEVKRLVGVTDHEKATIGPPHPFKPGEKRLTAPVHYNKSYHEIPRDMGMDARGRYGELSTQTGEKHKDLPMWKGKIRKSEKEVWEDWLNERGVDRSHTRSNSPAFSTTETLAAAAEHPDFPLIGDWMHHPDEDIRCAIARNPALTPEQQGVMLRDSSKYVRRNVAINPSLHLSHQMAIASNPHSHINDPSLVLKYWLSQNKNLHPEAAEMIIKQPEVKVGGWWHQTGVEH